MALSITGRVYAVHTSKLSESEVKRMAVQQCEMGSAITPCVLYALNDEVVFDPRNWVKKTKLIYNNNNVKLLPPPGSNLTALSKIKELLDQTGRKATSSNNEKYSITITANGYGYFGTGSTVKNAQDQSLRKCKNAKSTHGSRCIHYADSEGVKFSVKDIIARSEYPEFFCRTVRYSCAEHRAVGCDSGLYWVQNARTLAAETIRCR